MRKVTLNLEVFLHRPQAVIKKLKKDVPDDSKYRKKLPSIEKDILSLSSANREKCSEIVNSLNIILDKISKKDNLPKLKYQIKDAYKSYLKSKRKTKITISKDLAKAVKVYWDKYSTNRDKFSFESAIHSILNLCNLNASNNKDPNIIYHRTQGVAVVKKLKRVTPEVDVVKTGS